MPLAPASTVITRFPSELATLLAMHGGNQVFIATEVAGMSEVSVAKTANPSVAGTMNEFAFLANGYREYSEAVKDPGGALARHFTLATASRPFHGVS